MFLEECNKIDEKIYGNFYENKYRKKCNKKNKKVSFDLFIEIIYIPKYEKQNNYNHDNLWWSDYEMQMTRIGSRDEILTLLKKHTLMTLDHAKQLLYQPNNISYNSKNFL